MRHLLAVAVYLSVGPATSLAAADVVLPAPLQVEAILMLDDRYGETPWEVPRVVVDLGAAEERPRPARESFERVTLLGTEGFLPAGLEEIVKVCRYLCDDDLEECHYVGHFVPMRPLESLGTVVAALPGRFALEEYSPIEPQGPSAVAPGKLTNEFTSPIWPGEETGKISSRIRLDGDSGAYLYAWGESEPNQYPIRSCRWAPRGPLTRLVCEGFEALTADGIPLLVSLQDYNEAGADIVASFRYGTTDWYVLRLAIKAQTVHGLVYRDADGWHALILPRNYALLC